MTAALAHRGPDGDGVYRDVPVGIWNGPKYRSLRAALARGERPTRSCKLCYPQDLYNIVQLKSKLLP